MKRFIGTVQKRIGLLISVIGLAVVLTNLISISIEEDFISALGGFSVWSVFLATVPFIVSVFIESRLLKTLQVLVFLFMGIMNVMDSYQEFYGPGMFLASWLLMRHYGFLEKHAKIKNAAILLLLTGLSQFSAILHTQEGVYAGMTTLLYTLFLILLLIIIWRDMALQQEALKKENLSLRVNYRKLSAQLIELEEDQKPFDLKNVKISPAEERVIQTLTLYKASNREIAERLNIAESTVKLHLYNIYNKIGVDSRFDIIDLCKYNYKE